MAALVRHREVINLAGKL